jgi:hypothetical protein
MAAEFVAALDWFATAFEEAATRRRFVTAMSPKERITMAVRASMSVNPASGREADGVAGMGCFMVITLTAPG